VRIRAARAEDGPRLQALAREAHELHARIAPTFFRAGERGGEPDDFGDVSASAIGDRQAIWVATAGREIVGFVIVRLHETPDSQALVRSTRAQIENIAVARERRRQGIGRRLIDAAAAWARSRRAATLVLTVWEGNRAARRFYRSLGFSDLCRVMSRAP
jgi:ribosomal protein S18 acetylase RimI-like enzyme